MCLFDVKDAKKTKKPKEQSVLKRFFALLFELCVIYHVNFLQKAYSASAISAFFFLAYLIDKKPQMTTAINLIAFAARAL